MEIIDKAFTRAPRRYIVQSLLATVTLAIILYFVEVLTHAAIVAALGASTFIVFAMPNTISAQPRRLIGGHIIGLLSGILCYFGLLTGPLGELSKNSEVILWVAAATAVGLSIFLMTITNTEHPPASGTALVIVVHAWSYPVVVFIVLAAIALAIVRRLLRGYLRNLF